MSETFRLTLAQIAPTVGDIPGNIARARTAWAAAKDAGADLLVLPEMFALGYQPQDLVMRPAVWREAMDAVAALAADTAQGPALAIGAPFHDGQALYNALHICEGGKVRLRVLKQVLPNTDVFDEKRLFARGPDQGPFRLGPLLIGTPICEELVGRAEPPAGVLQHVVIEVAGTAARDHPRAMLLLSGRARSRCRWWS